MKAIFKKIAGFLVVPAITLIFCKANTGLGVLIQFVSAIYAVSYICVRYKGVENE